MKCLAVGMVSYSRTQDADLGELGATNLMKSEPAIRDDACTEENDEAEGVSLPVEDSSSARLQYGLALKDFTKLKHEVPYIDFSDNSTELAQNNETLLQNEDTDEIPLSRIKNERTILDDNDENSSASSIMPVKNELVDLYDLISVKPLIYTTKLDDMIVINNFNCNLDKSDLFKNILIESKPTFKPCYYDNYCSRTHVETEMSFKNLVEKLNMINMISNQSQTPGNKARTYDPMKSSNCIGNSVNVSERNRNLLKLCKPFSIILEDILKSKRFKRIPKGKARLLRKLDKIEYKGQKGTLLSMEIIDVIAKWRRINEETKMIGIILNNIKANFTEIYLLDSHGIIRQHYRNNVIKAEIYKHNLRKQVPHRLSMNVCCWFKREALIKSFYALIDTHVVPPFIKSRHHCKGTHCTCCCNPYVPINRRDHVDVQVIDDEPRITVQQPKNIIESLYNFYNKSDLFISTALRYTPIKKIQPKNPSKQAESHLRNAKIQLANNRTNENEFYTLGDNGEVVVYTKNKKQDKELCSSQTNLKHFTYCCWFEREKIIKKISSMVSSNALLFIRTPHECPLDNCCCCCKLINDIHLKRKVLKINIPMSSIHTSNNNKPTLVQIKFNDIHIPNLRKSPKRVTKTNDCNIIDLTNESLPVKTITKAHVKRDQNLNVTINSLKQNLTVPKKKVSNEIVQATNVGSLTSNKTDPQSNVDTSDPYAAGYTSPELNLKQLLASISERFSNVDLVINNEGKLAASINREGELSNADLKTLSHFLSTAQTQLDKLKLAPGTKIKISNIPTPYATAVTTNINKVTSILNHLNKDGTKELSTIIPDDAANKTQNMSKKTSVCVTASTLKDNVFGKFTNLYYANRINMLKAFSRTKNVLSSGKKTVNKIPSNSWLNTLNNDNETKTVNNLTDEIACETPSIAENTQSTNTTKFCVNTLKRPLGNPGPVQGVFSKIPASTKVENIGDERIDVFTHKPIVRNHNMANQNMNKRPRMETQVSSQSSNVTTQLDSASISGNTSGVRNTKLVGNTDSRIGVFPVASSPAQIPENIMIGTGVASHLQPLTQASPQTTIVKEESPVLAIVPLPVYTLGNEEGEKQGNDCILGM